MAGAIKIPYALTPAVALDVRRQYMQSAIARNLPHVDRAPTITDQSTLSLACYGPSLRDTYQQLTHPILSMSGATKYLAERGIIADYHLDMDPRENKIMTSLPAIAGVTYLVASVCAPAYFDALIAAGVDIRLWHTVSSNWEDELSWVAAHDRGALVVSGGSTIGLTAIQLGGLLGYRRFAIHGMDGSFAADGVRHAAVHHGKTQRDDITWDVSKIRYRTSKIMANACAETVNTCRNFPILCTFYGDGLTQALIREANLANACCADETDKREWLATRTIRIADVPDLRKGQRAVWDGLLDHLTQDDLPDLLQQLPICEARRARARYNTGSIPLETALLLRALCRYYQPQVIAEIGTFIGTSTHALQPCRVCYTCDRDNDCLPGTESVITHPFQSSTTMLTDISEPVDLFFFDGRIQPADLPHIQRLSHARTIYAFDDAVVGQKGVANLSLLHPTLPNHLFVPPHPDYHGRSTLAALVPIRRADDTPAEEDPAHGPLRTPDGA